MKPSQAALDHAKKGVHRLSFAALSERLMHRGLFSQDGKAVQLDGQSLQQFMALNHLNSIEGTINSLLVSVRTTKDREIKETLQSGVAKIAIGSTNDYTLEYVASMFLHEKRVMRALASNPHINVKTQLILASTEELRNDKEVQLALAHNPSLDSGVMVKMGNATDDQYVHLALAMNASKRSMAESGISEFSKICSSLAGSFNSEVRKTAISGIKDPESLRKFANNNSVFLMPRELEVVAKNPHTPDDVLEALASSMPKMQTFFSIHVAEHARSTLQAKHRTLEKRHEISSPSH